MIEVVQVPCFLLDYQGRIEQEESTQKELLQVHHKSEQIQDPHSWCHTCMDIVPEYENVDAEIFNNQARIFRYRKEPRVTHIFSYSPGRKYRKITQNK